MIGVSRSALLVMAVGLGIVAACASVETPDGTVGLVDGESRGRLIEIVRVIDGDSLEVLVGNEEIEVRLVGINAPERFTLADHETCVGQEARAALDEVLSAAGELRLQGEEVDRFDRLLADINADGHSVNKTMVELGWALALWSAGAPALTEAMMKAAADGQGWWGSTCGLAVATLEISDHQVDPPGRDDENLDQEWVEVHNPGSDPIDLDQWTIRDETTSNRFPLPAMTLGPGASLRVHTGSGSDSSTDLYLGDRFPVWSNRGESVLILDGEGRIAAYTFIEG
ncbi:MAG: hypothetical protein GY773_16840 [Actinomycetia bacterium]|nr:hypothetical protein [Actinomycetes bacterium]